MMPLSFKATIKTISTKAPEEGPSTPTTTIGLSARLDPLTFAGVYEHQTGEQVIVTIEKIEPEGFQAPLLPSDPTESPTPESGDGELGPDPGLIPAGVPEAFHEAFEEPAPDPPPDEKPKRGKKS